MSIFCTHHRDRQREREIVYITQFPHCVPGLHAARRGRHLAAILVALAFPLSSFASSRWLWRYCHQVCFATSALPSKRLSSLTSLSNPEMVGPSCDATPPPLFLPSMAAYSLAAFPSFPCLPASYLSSQGYHHRSRPSLTLG